MILVVEDQPDVRAAMVKLVKWSGYNAIGVADGAQALLFLQTTLPRLVILDHRMPGIEGLEVL